MRNPSRRSCHVYVEEASVSHYQSINPATGEVEQQFETLADSEIEPILAEASHGYRLWRAVPLAERRAIIKRAAELCRERSEALASIVTAEMGKPIVQARGEVSIWASIFDYFADNAEKFLEDERLEIMGGGEAWVRTDSIGVLLGIMPWNFPYYQAARFIAPNLMLGNAIILKHAPNCPRSALAIAEILRDAGVPGGVYTNVFATNDQVATMLADDRIQGVSLTGSERAGSAVGEIAGRHMKKYVLELGGSDPFIVVDPADMKAAAKAAAIGRMNNAGQVCTASKRFIVVESAYDEFVRHFALAIESYQPGDPLSESTVLGPLSTAVAVDELEGQVADAVEAGATLLVAGGRVAGPGNFFKPTVLAGVTREMRAYSEELFGPVAVVYRVADLAEAIELANESPFGLSASLFGADDASLTSAAAELDFGMVWINGISRSAPDLPFGGVKRSGVGRELSRYGMYEFANKKLVRIPA
ncbi:NAD-dependent succinate-semialdehyde dehydrogenase [Subtercola sp. PAMC28395]|uniref:NAD-dependent succinate-semialdehyde dehydrogenase n=1 Tax=Subtercola sp. PAMC28395 TaxID=2846775 RepID=UPI0021111341|nr:NAD-dependent succinate-semialdehyde dehydrogenase [Subtercola sp. PAMC28395]